MIFTIAFGSDADEGLLEEIARIGNGLVMGWHLFSEMIIGLVSIWPFLLLLTIRTEADSGWRPSGPIQDLALRGLSEGTAALLIRRPRRG